MKIDDFTQIFVKEKQSFLDMQFESKEARMEWITNHIVELETQCEMDYMTVRSKISAALSLIDDDATHIKLSRKLKEAKITPKNERVFTHAKGEIDIDGRKSIEFRLEEKESKKEKAESQAFKTAIKACSTLFGKDSSKIQIVLRNKYPKLTIEMINEVLA